MFCHNILLVTDIVEAPLLHVHALDVRELRDAVARTRAVPERCVVNDHCLCGVLHLCPVPSFHGVPSATTHHSHCKTTVRSDTHARESIAYARGRLWTHAFTCVHVHGFSRCASVHIGDQRSVQTRRMHMSCKLTSLIALMTGRDKHVELPRTFLSLAEIQVARPTGKYEEILLHGLFIDHNGNATMNRRYFSIAKITEVQLGRVA